MLKLLFAEFHGGRIGAALLVMRLFTGVAFVMHGSGKINDIAGFAAEYHVPFWMGAAAMLTQLVGGIFLIIGFLTPLAALGIASTVAVAALFLIQKGEPFINPAGHSWENAAFYTIAGIVLAMTGAGAYSADAFLFGRKKSSPIQKAPVAGISQAANSL